MKNTWKYIEKYIFRQRFFKNNYKISHDRYMLPWLIFCGLICGKLFKILSILYFIASQAPQSIPVKYSTAILLSLTKFIISFSLNNVFKIFFTPFIKKLIFNLIFALKLYTYNLQKNSYYLNL